MRAAPQIGLLCSLETRSIPGRANVLGSPIRIPNTNPPFATSSKWAERAAVSLPWGERKMAKICYTDASTTVAPVAQLDRATGFEAPDNHRIASRIVLFLSISSRRTADRRL